MENSNKPTDILSRLFILLKWVDSWKKLIILMVLVMFFTLGYTVWEHRRQLSFIAMSAFGSPQIDSDTIESESTNMLADVGGISVAVWAINLERNHRSAIFVRVKEQRLSNLEGVGDLVLRPYSRMTADVISLINNKTACFPLVANTAVGRSAQDAGVTYVCAAAIPPEFGTMIGMLAVGFIGQPANEDYVKLRIQQAAERILK